jgi:very-short-patch-repair endonuclease
VAVELDGYRWHRTGYRQDADRRREVRLRQLGWLPVRYSAAQIFDTPLAVVADVASVLAARRS